MKHLFLLILLAFGGNAGFAQTDSLRSLDRSKLNSEFLQQLFFRPIVHDDDFSATPVFSWLEAKCVFPSNARWRADNSLEKYEISVASCFPHVTADFVSFVSIAYTKGDFAVAICGIDSYHDINEARVYTFDYDGNVIDSLVFDHRFHGDGFLFMPLCGAVMRNLDVLVCEINWLETNCPYDLETRYLKNGQQKGQRVDSYYIVDGTGHFILKKQTKFLPMMYRNEDIASQAFCNGFIPKGTIYQGNEPVLEVIEY